MSGLSTTHSGIDIHHQIPFPRYHTPKVSIVYPIIPYKVFSSWNSRIIRIISAKESGDYSLKKERVENERRKSHSPKELQTRSSNKRLNSLSKCESIFLHPLTSHKIGIWLSSNPSWITIRLGNIGNQGMWHSPYLQTPHISIRSREKRVKNSDPMWGSYTLSDSRVPLGNLSFFEKKILEKLQVRNLNKQQKIFQWRLFSSSTAQDQGMKTDTPHLPEP